MTDLDRKIKRDAQTLLTQLRALEQIERTGAAPIHPSRTVRSTIYSLADLLREVDGD